MVARSTILFREILQIRDDRAFGLNYGTHPSQLLVSTGMTGFHCNRQIVTMRTLAPIFLSFFCFVGVVGLDSSQAVAATSSNSANQTSSSNLSSVPLEQLWERFASVSSDFNALLDSSQSTAPNSQTGYRQRVNAIQKASELRAIVAEILQRNVLSREDEQSAIDTFLTAQQVKGSLMVDIGDCKEAKSILQELANDPATKKRKLLLDATNKWVTKAQRCYERQLAEEQLASEQRAKEQEELKQLQDEIRAAELKKRNDEIARLQRELDEAKRRELEADVHDNRSGVANNLRDVPRTDAPKEEEKPPSPKQLGLGLSIGMSQVPEFIPGLAYSLHGSPKLALMGGGFFFIRKNDKKRDITINYDATAVDFGSSWWLKNDHAAGDAKWLELRVPKHTITVGVERNFMLDKKKNFHFHLGALFGLSILPSTTFVRQTVDPGQCLYDIPDGDMGPYTERFAVSGACHDARVDDGHLKLPPVLPSIGLRLGFRYIIANRVQVGVQGGVQDGYFFGQIAAGVILADTTPKPSQEATSDVEETP